jgi:hypothetical protein
MYELRWLRKNDHQSMDQYIQSHQQETRVLQYRVKYDKTVWAVPAGVQRPASPVQMVWSEWIDVQEVTENKENSL